MSERIKQFIKGIASTMEFFPAETPPPVVTDKEERLRRPWERTGQAIQRAADRFASEQPTSQ